MRDLRLTVLQRLAGKVGERAAGFVHQKIGRRKVPIVTAGRCKCRLQCPLRNTCNPQCKGMHLGLSHYFGRNAGQPLQITLGAGKLGSG